MRMALSLWLGRDCGHDLDAVSCCFQLCAGKAEGILRRGVPGLQTSLAIFAFFFLNPDNADHFMIAGI